MAEYTLNFFDLSHISTDDPDGFSDNGGYQFDMGVSTVTIGPGAVSQALTVSDTADSTFDDDAAGTQTLSGGHTIDGVPYGDGTQLESEYELIVQDSLGNNYVLQFVSVGTDAYNIGGFVVQGAMPPWNEPLTVVGRGDMTSGTYSYAASAPACFGADARVETTRGMMAAGALQAGDMLVLADGGAARLRLVLHSHTALSGAVRDAPVRLRAGALGPDMPLNDLVLSPQHRVLLPHWDTLVSARALTALPRIGPIKGLRRIHYVHLVLDHHALLLVNGVICESFWPGDMGLAGLAPATVLRIRRIMGATPSPARRFLPTGQAQRMLAATVQKPVAGRGVSG